MTAVLPDVRVLEALRDADATIRRGLRARKHEGGVWVCSTTREADRWLLDAVERFGEKTWAHGRWRVRRPQLTLPGISLR